MHSQVIFSFPLDLHAQSFTRKVYTIIFQSIIYAFKVTLTPHSLHKNKTKETKRATDARVLFPLATFVNVHLKKKKKKFVQQKLEKSSVLKRRLLALVPKTNKIKDLQGLVLCQ